MTAAAVCLRQRLSSSSDFCKGNSLNDQGFCQPFCPGLVSDIGQEGKPSWCCWLSSSQLLPMYSG